jgi:hypothetical protein
MHSTVLNTVDTLSVVKLHWDARKQLEFFQVHEHLLLPPPPLVLQAPAYLH